MQAPATRRRLGQLTVASQEKHTLPACSEPEKHRLTAASGQIPRNNRKQTLFSLPFHPPYNDRGPQEPRTTDICSLFSSPSFPSAIPSALLGPSSPPFLPPPRAHPPCLPPSLPPRDSECPCRTDTVAIRAH